MAQMSGVSEEAHSSQEAPKQSDGIDDLQDARESRRPQKVYGDGPRRGAGRPPAEGVCAPPYREGMPHCTSNEKYLRPTRWCNPREPLVIAMANELGAYELSDREFAEAAFWFVKTKFTVEFLSLNNVAETLKRGTGTCVHLNSAWIALCRAAGIKARYKTFNMTLRQENKRAASEEGGEIGEMTASMLGGGFPEMEGEVCIDGKWTVGHVAMRPELCAFNYLPVPRFGEDAIGLTLDLAPGGKIKRSEAAALLGGPALKVMFSLFPAIGQRANLMTKGTTAKGRKIIEEAGGLEEYDRKLRENRLFQTVEPKDHESLVFEE